MVCPNYKFRDQNYIAIGWIVTFIIDVRGGGPSSGYISSGFFGGKLDTHRKPNPSSSLFLQRTDAWACSPIGCE